MKDTDDDQVDALTYSTRPPLLDEWFAVYQRIREKTEIDMATNGVGNKKQEEALKRERLARSETVIERITRKIQGEQIARGIDFAFPQTIVQWPVVDLSPMGGSPSNIEVQVRVLPDESRKVASRPLIPPTPEEIEKKAKLREAELELEKKRAYQPGMPIAEFVANQIDCEKDAERLKWLRTFQSCVLPADVRESIEEALTTVLMAKRFSEWGVDEAFEKGLTNSILLYGPPGTGKTMIAESFAAVLGKNLLMIGSADIQSQIPGEAERNITKNFERAGRENAVLMFDECDSLLYDRNAVGMIMASEINHLLTCIERFDGIVILTTNRLARLDPALQRRIIAKVELGLPGEEARLQIWKNLVPKKVPVADDVDYSMLAKLEFSGGEIKNVILTAIRKAIAKNCPAVTAEHFANACRTAHKAKRDFEDGRPQIVPHEDVTMGHGRDIVRRRTMEKVSP